MFLHSDTDSECHLDTPLSGTLDVLENICCLNVLYDYVYIFVYLCTITGLSTVKPVLVATSIKQATCIKQACIQISKQATILKCNCIKQAPVLSKSKKILIVT